MTIQQIVRNMNQMVCDDETPIASSGTQQYTSWNALEKGEDLNDFFARIYKQSQIHMMQPTVKDTQSIDPHGCIPTLLGADKFPLWSIRCRVCFFFFKNQRKMFLN